MKMSYDVLPFEPCEMDEYHAPYSIQLCELLNSGGCGFDLTVDEWDYYNEEQRIRLWKKFKRRFYYRELGIFPASRWRWELLRKLDEIMPKYKQLYKMLENGQNILQHYGEYGKSRNVFSDFPQTLLGGNQDYASNANDRENEEIYLGDWMEQMEKIKTYDDIDVMILKELETMFSQMYTVTIAGY